MLCFKKYFIFKAEQFNAKKGLITVPWSQLVLTPPGEFSEALVALVVVVEHTVERGSTQVHQSVVGRLLLLPTGVAIEQVVDLIRYFWKGKRSTIICQHRQLHMVPQVHKPFLFPGRQMLACCDNPSRHPCQRVPYVSITGANDNVGNVDDSDFHGQSSALLF